MAWIRPSDIGMPDAHVSDEKPFSDWIPLVRLSDAEAIIAAKDAEIERLSLYKNLAAEYGLSVFADLAKQSAAPTPPVSEDRKDAERYRWLRSSSTGPSQIWELLSDDCQPPILTLKSMGDLDAAIDAAMEGK